MAIERLSLRSEADLARLRARLGQLVADARAFDLARALTVASELGRNCLLHGGGGHCELRVEPERVAGPGRVVGARPRRTLRMRFVDQGPGIPDLEAAFSDGWTSAGGLGLGLGGSRRLADGFRLDTRIGGGTRIDVAMRC